MKTIPLSAMMLLPLVYSLAIAQTYPLKPVRLVVPTAPGGGTDLVGRVLAQNLSQSLAQQVIVDNRGGAGTTLGSAVVAKSAPDGYTLLLNHVSLAFNATYYPRLSTFFVPTRTAAGGHAALCPPYQSPHVFLNTRMSH